MCLESTRAPGGAMGTGSGFYSFGVVGFQGRQKLAKVPFNLDLDLGDRDPEQ